LTLPIRDAATLDSLKKQIARRPSYGYRRITLELRKDGWVINFKRVYRLWQAYDLKAPVPKGHPRRGMSGTSANACDKKRPEHINHIWSYDFMTQYLENGRKARILNVLDEYTRECLTMDVGQRIKAQDVIEVLRYLFLIRGAPAYIRSDNGPEFTAKQVKKWLSEMDVHTLFIEPGSPWENGYMESFNGHFRQECLDREIVVSLAELRYICDRYRTDYNHHRPHQSLGYLTPAQFAATVRRSSGALPPAPRNLSHCASAHRENKKGQPKLADAPMAAARSGCIPAAPYPDRGNSNITQELQKDQTAFQKGFGKSEESDTIKET
jgi:transposase InsO family protein